MYGIPMSARLSSVNTSTELLSRLKLSQSSVSGEVLIEALNHKLTKGGLAQISSHKGGSRTCFALSCLRYSLKNSDVEPPLSLWISDGGILYPEPLHYYWKIPLARFVQVSAPGPPEVWRLGLESVQTGLFEWVFLRTEQVCHPTFLRKLQLSAERTTTRVLILCQKKLAHWTLKSHLQLEESHANTVLPKSVVAALERL